MEYVKKLGKKNKLIPCVVKYDDNNVYTNLIWAKIGVVYIIQITHHFEKMSLLKAYGFMIIFITEAKDITKESMQNPDYIINTVDLDGKIEKNKENFKKIDEENFSILKLCHIH